LHTDGVPLPSADQDFAVGNQIIEPVELRWLEAGENVVQTKLFG